MAVDIFDLEQRLWGVADVVMGDTNWPDKIAQGRGHAVEEARWALRAAWKQVERKEAEEDPVDRAA